MRSPTTDPHHAITLAWIVRLRWLAGAAQALVLGVAAPLVADLPVAPLAAVIGLGLVSNLGLWLAGGRRPVSDGLLLGVLALDAGLLTALLALSGGASNPFSGLYLVVVGLGALVLRPAGAFALLAVCAIAYGALFTEPLGGGGHLGHPGMRGHLIGMWVAFVLGASFLSFAIVVLRRRLEVAEREAGEARGVAERAARLASLATLAAGAAHELATPLSTVAVVAGDLQRSADSDLREDGALLARQVERCRRILHQLAADAGAGLGEGRQVRALDALLREAVADRAVTLTVDPALGDVAVEVPVELLSQALRRVLDNALSSGDAPAVSLAARVAAGRLELVVRDRGAGMTPDVLARVGEPFFTTRPTGEGMGLGVYFARSVAEHLGGGLTLASTPGEGTAATLWFPLATIVP